MTVPHESPAFVPLSQDHGAAGKGGWFAGNLEWMLALLINWLRGKSKAPGPKGFLGELKRRNVYKPPVDESDVLNRKQTRLIDQFW